MDLWLTHVYMTDKLGMQSQMLAHGGCPCRQVDLINYGLIPEFVGRFPIICSLQVRAVPVSDPMPAGCRIL